MSNEGEEDEDEDEECQTRQTTFSRVWNSTWTFFHPKKMRKKWIKHGHFRYIINPCIPTTLWVWVVVCLGASKSTTAPVQNSGTAPIPAEPMAVTPRSYLYPCYTLCPSSLFSRKTFCICIRESWWASCKPVQQLIISWICRLILPTCTCSPMGPTQVQKVHCSPNWWCRIFLVYLLCKSPTLLDKIKFITELW